MCNQRLQHRPMIRRFLYCIASWSVRGIGILISSCAPHPQLSALARHRPRCSCIKKHRPMCNVGDPWVFCCEDWSATRGESCSIRGKVSFEWQRVWRVKGLKARRDKRGGRDVGDATSGPSKWAKREGVWVTSRGQMVLFFRGYTLIISMRYRLTYNHCHC